MQDSNDIIIILQKQLEKVYLQNKNLKKQLAQAKLQPRHCPQNHILSFQVMQWGSEIICDLCNKEINDFSYMNWVCQQCDYNECYKCGGLPKDYCNNNHQLKQKEFDNQSPYQCNICLNHLKDVLGYRCQECDYDICAKCNGKETNEEKQQQQ